MTNKIIHLADVHIRTYRLHSEYEEAFETLYAQLREIVNAEPDTKFRIAIVGDLVHQKITISNEQLVLCCAFLQKLAEIAPVVIVAGNHDLLENNKDRLDSITPMIRLLSNPRISYLKESKCYDDGSIVWCNYSIFEENAKPDIEAGRKKFGADKTYVGLFHGPLIGATTDIGYEFEHGTALEHFEGCDMVLLGDIHKIQEFNYRGVPIRFSGSLVQQNFGETLHGHGFSVWDVATRTSVHHELETDFGFYQFKIKSLEDLDNGTEILTNA